MLFHNPVILSKSFATLDVFSQGRTIAGFGIGWSRDEYRLPAYPSTTEEKGLMVAWRW